MAKVDLHDAKDVGGWAQSPAPMQSVGHPLPVEARPALTVRLHLEEERRPVVVAILHGALGNIICIWDCGSLFTVQGRRDDA